MKTKKNKQSTPVQYGINNQKKRKWNKIWRKLNKLIKKIKERYRGYGAVRIMKRD